MLIEKALSIEGWMSEKELSWLAEQATNYQRIVEIGSHLGRSTRALGDNTPGVVYAVDHWCGPAEVTMAIWEREKIYDQFLENMNGLIESKKVIPLRVNHRSVTVNFIPDMVFIDGSHEYEDFIIDLQKWRHCTGLLCGHDATWPGVTKALREQDFDVDLVPDTDIWMRL